MLVRPRIAAMLLVCSAVGACTPVPGPAAAPPHAPYRGPLASSLQVEPMGDSARLVLQVTNASEAAVPLQFASGQSYDFAVLDGAREVWRWSADRMFTQALRNETLAAGETRRYAEIWHPAAALHGRDLTARAWLTASDQPLEQSAQFRLP